MATKKQTLALNRASRMLFARVRKLHEELTTGAKNPEEAARLRRAFAEIRPDIKRVAELNHSRTQALAAHSLTIEGAKAREMLKSMSKVELRGALPALIERANAGDKEALTFLGAAVGVISNMPADDRPITITKLARLVSLPEYDVAAAEIHEANFFVDAADRMLPRLEAGQLPATQDMVALGVMRRELDGGGGWRDIATLAETSAELRKQPEKETHDAPPNSEQPDQTDNAHGQDQRRETDPPNPDTSANGEADKSGANQSRSEITEGEQA